MSLDSEIELREWLTKVIQSAAEDLSSDTRLAYLEHEAASLLGVQCHVLRDARLRGEIISTRIGGRIGYETSEIKAYLERNRSPS